MKTFLAGHNRFAACSVVVVSLAVWYASERASANHADDPKPKAGDAKLIEGTWQLESGEMAGQKIPDEVTKTLTLKIEGGKFTLKSPGPDDTGTTTLDATKTPKELDVKGTEGPNKGKTFLAIYELTGDSLKVCYDLDGKKRPTEFKTAKDTKLFLAVYKRKKD